MIEFTCGKIQQQQQTLHRRGRKVTSVVNSTTVKRVQRNRLDMDRQSYVFCFDWTRHLMPVTLIKYRHVHIQRDNGTVSLDCLCLDYSSGHAHGRVHCNLVRSLWLKSMRTHQRTVYFLA